MIDRYVMAQDLAAAYSEGVADAKAGRPAQQHELDAAYRQGYRHGERSVHRVHHFAHLADTAEAVEVTEGLVHDADGKTIYGPANPDEVERYWLDETRGATYCVPTRVRRHSKPVVGRACWADVAIGDLRVDGTWSVTPDDD